MTQRTESAPATPLPPPKERRRLREAKSLTQEQIAAALGVTRETVRSWESGRRNPKRGKRAAYAELLASSSAPAASRDTVPGGDAPGRSPQGVEHNTPEQTPVPERSAPEETPRRVTDPEAPAPAPAPSQEPEHPPTLTIATPTPTPTPPISEPPAPPPTPAQAFDALYTRSAPAVLAQAYLLTGSRRLSRESVEYAFHFAWQRWPEVATDRDPAGWIRAVAHEYATSPWHRLRLARKHPDRPSGDRDRRVLLDALLDLPPRHRRTLVLYDGLGLDLPDTAAETEASTPAAAGRLLNARAAVARRLPELANAGTPAEQSALFHERLGDLAETGPVPPVKLPPALAVRMGSERRTRFWTRAAAFFTAAIVGATGFTLTTAPTRYESPRTPGEPVGGIPVHAGPQTLSPQDEELRDKLRADPMNGPHRLVPETR